MERLTLIILCYFNCFLCFCQDIPYKKIILCDSLPENRGLLKSDQLNRENTIYVIESCYELCGVLELPKGCILKFEGGSIHGGTIKGNYNEIVAPRYKIFYDVRLEGHFSVSTVYPEWWGGYPDRDIDCYDAIQKALDFASAYGGDEGKNVQLSVGKYGISKTLILKQGCRLFGISPRSTWLYSLNGNIDGDWMIDTPYKNRNQPVSSSRIENIQVRCTNEMHGEQFEKSCSGIRCRGWNENCGIKNVHINGYSSYGLYLSRNERTVTQNCNFCDVYITNSNCEGNFNVGLFLDNARQNVFESITIDNGTGTKMGVEFGIYAQGYCDMNIFNKLYLEDCYHPIYVKDGIDECTFISLMVSNPTHPMKYYSNKEFFRTSILMEQCNRGFTIVNYKRNRNEGVEYDIVDLKNKKHLVFNDNNKTGNSNVRFFEYCP